MQVQFSYDKKQVIQALRYHFLSRREIRLMIVAVNVFALSSVFLFYSKKILPPAFVVGSLLWFVLMLSFWFVLPYSVYKRAHTFSDHFVMTFTNESFSLGNERGGKTWPWTALSSYLETPHFFHLYFDSRSFFLVPKESFENDERRSEMRRLLREKIVKK